MQHILITGINGFVGHHLAKELATHNITVIGTGTDAKLDPKLNNYVDKFYGGCDLTDPQNVAKLPLEKLDSVINLAGLAQVGASFGVNQMDKYKLVNTNVHTVIAQQLARLNKPIRLIAVSTGAVYDSNQPMPITEESKLIASGSPYALSKINMEEALATLGNDNLEIIIARPFNHIGPGQLGGFLVPDLVEKLSNLGVDKTLLVGNLQTKRDYTDVRDVARAYRLLATSKSLHHNLYNICSGISHSGQEILSTLSHYMGVDNLSIKIDPDRIRPDDPANIYGSADRLKQDTGWTPSIPLQKTLKDILGL